MPPLVISLQIHPYLEVLYTSLNFFLLELEFVIALGALSLLLQGFELQHHSLLLDSLNVCLEPSD